MRPTRGATGALGDHERLKVADGRAASRPECLAGRIAPSPPTAPAVSAAQPGWTAN